VKPADVCNISRKIEENYITFGIEVNTQRSFPLVYDGFKPVQRRLLINGAHLCVDGDVKSARLIGDTLGKNHPHGDVSLYESLVNLVNDDNPLFIGQGNWGGYQEVAAAMRYTEVRLSKFAKQYYLPYMNYAPVFENEMENREIEYVPTKIPYALVNGAYGIGLGIATNIPSFSLKSIEAYVKWLQSPGRRSAPDLELNWPDFDMDASVVRDGEGRICYKIIYERFKIDDQEGFLVKGNPPQANILIDLQKILRQEIEKNKVCVENWTDKEGVKIGVGKIKWINMENIEPKVRSAAKTVRVSMNWSMDRGSKPIVKKLSPGQVLELALEKYEKARDLWKETQIHKTNLEILFHQKKREILSLLASGKKWSEIQSSMGLTDEQVDHIKGKSVNQLSAETNPISDLQTKLKEIQATV
jgi:hypothetical protein